MHGPALARTSTRARFPVFGVATGVGGCDMGCAEGPRTLRADRLTLRLAAAGMSAPWTDIIEPANPSLSQLEIVVDVCERLAPAVAEAMGVGDRPVVIGGDHSIAMGTWSGFHNATRHRGPMGLLWVDAHMDSHVPETSPTGNFHGMPLAVLMGHGEDRLTAIADAGPALRPENLALVGIRSYEPEEEAFLERLGVRVYFMDEVRDRSLAVVMEEALEIVSRNTACLGVSLDLDSVDPTDAPGVALPEPGGLRAGELLSAVESLIGGRDVQALEIVEYCPSNDQDGRTANLLESLITAAFNGMIVT